MAAGFKTLGFLAAFLLVLAGTSQAPKPVSAAEGYPADFDPLYDLPLPPAWRDSADFATTAEALRDQIATAGKARVRVDLRLPAVEGDRLDEAQSAQWEQDQVAAGADLLDSLPDGSYQRLDERPQVNSLGRVGTGAEVADGEAGAMDDTTAFGGSAGANTVRFSSATLSTPSLTLTVGEAALAGLMASALVAQVQTSSGNARIAAGGQHSLYLQTNGSLWAWGRNGSGALGDGTTTNRATPTPILIGVAAIAAGGYHTLALKTDGSLWAWGYNGYGQLGNWATGRLRADPRLSRSSPGSPPWPVGVGTPWPSRPTAASGPGAITVTGNWATGRPRADLRPPRSSPGSPPSPPGVPTPWPSRPTAASGLGAITATGNWATGRPRADPRLSRSSPGSPPWPGMNTPSPSRPTAASGPGAITLTGNWATERLRIVTRLSRSSPGSPPSPPGVITPWPSRPTAASGLGAITSTGNWATGQPPIAPARFN